MPGLERVFGTFNLNTPQYYLDVDRTKAEMLGVPVENVFRTLQIFLGSDYVNDFNLFGRTYRVVAQSDAPHRLEPRDVARLHARNTDGQMVPLGSIVQMHRTAGTDRIVRYNLYPAAEIQGSAAPGVSTGQALELMEGLAARVLPPGIGFEWTELALQERLQSSIGLLLFPLSVLFAFLFLTAQYESWSLPIAIILIVPLCILFALTGVSIGGMDNNILTQVGMIVLIGLACKNSILIVEFARQYEEKGRDRFAAATEAAYVRLRPILMTSFAFISGVFPMVVADGAGSEMRRVLGTTVFSGMIGVTLVGLFLTPVFYTVIRGIVARREEHRPSGVKAV
jgi:multidrug efflux pump